MRKASDSTRDPAKEVELPRFSVELKIRLLENSMKIVDAGRSLN